MMQNGRINSPSLDLACPQVEADIEKYVHMFRDRGVDKKKIQTWGHHDHSYNSNMYGFYHMISYAQLTIYSQRQVWIRNFIENQQTIISVIEAIAIYHNIRKSQE